MKSGQVEKAGSLFSAAARKCLDLGLHELPPGVADLYQSRGRKVLWYVFLMDKGLALTLGRPQALHFYDVSTDTSSHPDDVLGIPVKVAAAFYELAVIEGEMMPQLFSAAARRLDADIVRERGRGFHERLKQIRLDLVMASLRGLDMLGRLLTRHCSGRLWATLPSTRRRYSSTSSSSRSRT